MVTVPAVTPVTIPVLAPTDAVPVLLLLHVPPVVAELSVVTAPVHTVDAPDIAAGNGLTVTTAITRQPVGSV